MSRSHTRAVALEIALLFISPLGLTAAADPPATSPALLAQAAPQAPPAQVPSPLQVVPARPAQVPAQQVNPAPQPAVVQQPAAAPVAKQPQESDTGMPLLDRLNAEANELKRRMPMLRERPAKPDDKPKQTRTISQDPNRPPLARPFQSKADPRSLAPRQTPDQPAPQIQPAPVVAQPSPAPTLPAPTVQPQPAPQVVAQPPQAMPAPPQAVQTQPAPVQAPPASVPQQPAAAPRLVPLNPEPAPALVQQDNPAPAAQPVPTAPPAPAAPVVVPVPQVVQTQPAQPQPVQSQPSAPVQQPLVNAAPQTAAPRMPAVAAKPKADRPAFGKPFQYKANPPQAAPQVVRQPVEMKPHPLVERPKAKAPSNPAVASHPKPNQPPLARPFQAKAEPSQTALQPAIQRPTLAQPTPATPGAMGVAPAPPAAIANVAPARPHGTPGPRTDRPPLARPFEFKATPPRYAESRPSQPTPAQPAPAGPSPAVPAPVELPPPPAVASVAPAEPSPPAMLKPEAEPEPKVAKTPQAEDAPSGSKIARGKIARERTSPSANARVQEDTPVRTAPSGLVHKDATRPSPAKKIVKPHGVPAAKPTPEAIVEAKPAKESISPDDEETPKEVAVPAIPERRLADRKKKEADDEAKPKIVTRRKSSQSGNPLRVPTAPAVASNEKLEMVVDGADPYGNEPPLVLRSNPIRTDGGSVPRAALSTTSKLRSPKSQAPSAADLQGTRVRTVIARPNPIRGSETLAGSSRVNPLR